jgi:hypothetical protein
MAKKIIHVCDRCGAPLAVPHRIILRASDMQRDDLELCGMCFGMLLDWLRNEG